MNKVTAKEGFTLVEILISVAILAVTLTAMANLVIVTMRANQSNMNTLQGYYLAQQGIEAMRNLRDSNWMQNYGWNQGDDLWGTDFACSMDDETLYFLVDENTDVQVSNLDVMTDVIGERSLGLFESSSVTNPPWELTLISEDSVDEVADLYIVAESAGYDVLTHDGDKESGFSRYIKVYYEECDDVAEVSSIVTWNERGNDREIVLTTYLTNWNN